MYVVYIFFSFSHYFYIFNLSTYRFILLFSWLVSVYFFYFFCFSYQNRLYCGPYQIKTKQHQQQQNKNAKNVCEKTDLKDSYLIFVVLVDDLDIFSVGLFVLQISFNLK